jgi:hypothetical protein
LGVIQVVHIYLCWPSYFIIYRSLSLLHTYRPPSSRILPPLSSVSGAKGLRRSSPLAVYPASLVYVYLPSRGLCLFSHKHTLHIRIYLPVPVQTSHLFHPLLFACSPGLPILVD